MPGSEPANAITARLYATTGDTLAYVRKLDGDTIEGSWEWPGGGYKETMTRVGA